MTYQRVAELLGLEVREVASALSLCEGCRYTQRTIRRGRIVWEPRRELKLVQQSVHHLIQSGFEPHRIAHAYIRNRGIITNAKQHVRKQLLLHLDLINFFPSISAEAVARKLQHLFPHLKFFEIETLADLCCFRGRLPQGAPSSPILSNLVCKDLDEELDSLAQSLSFDLSRFSDDFTFSTNDDHLPEAIVKVRGRGATRQIEVGTELSRRIERHGFLINPRKLRFQTRSDRQQVTGLTVNDGVSVPVEFRRGIRAMLNRWKTLGVAAAAARCREGMTTEKFESSVSGRIAFVRQVEGESCPHYQRFSHDFAELKARDASYLKANAPL